MHAVRCPHDCPKEIKSREREERRECGRWQSTVDTSAYVHVCGCVCGCVYVWQTLNRNILKHPQTVYQRWMQRVTPWSVNQSEVEPPCVYLKHFGTLSLRIWLQGLKKTINVKPLAAWVNKHGNGSTWTQTHSRRRAPLPRFLPLQDPCSALGPGFSAPASRPLALWLITIKSPTVTTGSLSFYESFTLFLLFSDFPPSSVAFQMTLLLLLLLSLFLTKLEDCSLTGAQLVFLQILLIQGTSCLCSHAAWHGSGFSPQLQHRKIPAQINKGAVKVNNGNRPPGWDWAVILRNNENLWAHKCF